jgi:2-polyprenyl-3-methyl-5-hydroxy-6-metoxy-1,4-benzoquinol methylase
MGKEMDSEYYNKVYESDHKYVGKYTQLPHFPIFQIALSYIKELRNPYILELGCGTGQFAQFLWEHGFREYMGYDFSEKAIELARHLSPQVFKRVDCAECEVPPEFDIIVALEVLEHIEKDLHILSCIPQGKVAIFSVPRFDDPAHVRHFISKEQVQERYGKIIKIDDLMKYKNWYIAKGVRCG